MVLWQSATVPERRGRLPARTVRSVSRVDLESGLTLSYAERGGLGDDAVVLLPGPTDSWRSYGTVLDLIPESVRVVAVSLRGHGDSSSPQSGYRVEDLASDVVPFLDRLGIARAVLVGHSGSCLVARRVAFDAAHRVAGLLLEASPTTLRGDPGLVAFVDLVVSELTDPIDVQFARSFVADTSSDDLAPELVEVLVEDLRKVPVHAWQEMFTSLLEYDDTAELAGLTAPVRLIWGDADPLVPRTMQDELVRLVPDAELTTYEGVGHTPRWEQPERFARDLAAFASRALT